MQQKRGERFIGPPFWGTISDPFLEHRILFFGGTPFFERSGFGLRFGFHFGKGFVTEKSSKRRPKGQEKEKSARDAKMWFGYGRRYTGGTSDGVNKTGKSRKGREKARPEVGPGFGPRLEAQNGTVLRAK